MIRPPDPRAVSFALSGFVVGVLVTLVATGTLFRASSDGAATPTVALPPKTPPGAMSSRVRAIVLKQLGPSLTGQKTARLVSIQVLPVVNLPEQYQPREIDPRFRSIYIEFRLNDHPLGKVWRLRAAKADVFAVLKALYTSNLPVYDVEMVGRFPLPQRKKLRESDAVIAFMSHNEAQHIPWKRWGRDHEAQVWSELSYKIVEPGFG